MSFAEKWAFIQIPFAACLAIGLILGYLGRHVLKREVIFIDISLAQFSALGATIAHFCFGGSDHHDGAHPWQEYLVSFLVVVVVAFFYAVVKKNIRQISIEAVIGVTYAVGFAGVLFISGVFGAEHGHMHEMLFGDFFALTAWTDLTTPLAILYGVAVLCLVFYEPLNHITEIYNHEDRESKRDVVWDILFYSIMGAVITIAVPLIGVVLIFVYLVMPAALAAFLTRCVWLQLLIIMVSVAVSSAGGLFFSTTDFGGGFSMGPPIGACMGVLLVVTVAGKKTLQFFVKAGRSS